VIPGSQWSRSASLDQRVTDGALRYRMDLASASNAGFVVTAREGDGYSSVLGGFDASLRFTPSDRLEFQVLASRTDYPDSFAVGVGQPTGEFDGTAYEVELSHDSGAFDWWAAHMHVDDGFRADMGYRPRADFRQTRGGWAYAWRAEAGSWYTVVNTGFGYVHNEALDGEMLESFLDYWINYAGPLRSSVDVYGMIGDEAFDGSEYDNTRVSINAAVWPGGSTRLGLNATVGNAVDYFNRRAAERVYLEPLVTLKLARRLDVVLSHEYERLDVDDGRLYTANISYLRTAYQFTKRAFLRAILQYEDYDYNAALYSDDRESRYRQLASQVLFSYKINPQTVLYLGYSDAHESPSSEDLIQKERTFFAKIGYALVL
jgi:hypothetical protein